MRLNMCFDNECATTAAATASIHTERTRSLIKPRSRRGGGRPTIADVARKAGVGAITVSRALARAGARFGRSAPPDRRRPSTTLGYVPDPNARALASARAEVFGVLVPSLTNNVFADVVRGIYDGLTRQPVPDPDRQHALFRPGGGTAAAGVPRPAAGRADRVGHRPDADVAPAARDGRLPGGADHGDRARSGRHDGRLLAFRRRQGGDRAPDRGAATGASASSARAWTRARSAALPAIARRWRRPACSTRGWSPPRRSRPACRSAASCFATRWPRRRRSTRVFCNNDDLALGVLFECHRASIDVPQTIGIAGFNDLDMMQVAFPRSPACAPIATKSAGARSPWRGRAIDGQRPQQPGRRPRLRAQAPREHRTLNVYRRGAVGMRALHANHGSATIFR